MIDWTGDPNELLTLQDASALVPGADADTLKRLIRRGKLRAYRPGKKYLTTRADVHAAVIGCRVLSPAERGERQPAPVVSNSLGLTETDLARFALDQALEAAEKKRLQRIEDEWERKYEARKAARKPPRSPT